MTNFKQDKKMEGIINYVNRFVDSLELTSNCTASLGDCGDADSKKLSANFFIGGDTA